MKIVYGIFLLMILLSPFRVQANNCSFSGGTSEESHSVSFGNVIVQRDLAVGSEIASVSTGDYAVRVGCTGSFVYRQELSKWGSPSSLGNKIYNTNIPGVGVQITDEYWGNVPFDAAMNFPAGGALGPYLGYRVKLIKTGDITGGTLGAGTLARGSIVNEFYLSDVVLSGTNTVTSVACSVTTPQVDVSLGNHDKNEFSGVGTATGWQTFDIGLDCNPNARINVRIDAAQDASNIPGVMKLDDDGSGTTASGVGVELWFRPDSSAVQFGQTKYYYTSPYGGSETVQLQARYHQTAQTVTAGQANATATFTLSYK